MLLIESVACFYPVFVKTRPKRTLIQKATNKRESAINYFPLNFLAFFRKYKTKIKNMHLHLKIIYHTKQKIKIDQKIKRLMADSYRRS
jgi:predicted ATP-grasp superfamily ATP-dependent carboligase